MNPLDLFFKKYSYKFPKGYPDMNNEQDIKLLNTLLEGLGVDLNEAETETQDFESFIQKKSSSILPEFIDKVTKSLSDDQKSRILKGASNNITEVIKFLNNNQDISKILTNIKGGPQGEGNMGPGEVAVLTCSINGEKISGKAGDVELNGVSYELKGGKVIKAGGTYRPSITRLTTTLWFLKQEIFEGDNAEQYKKILGPELFNEWESFRGMQKNKEGEIDFTSIGKDKLTQVKSFFEKLRTKIKNISDEDTSKPNVISVGSKDFEVSKDELTKISSAKPGEQIALTGKVVLSQESEVTLTKLRQNLKILTTSKILSEEDNLDDAVKREFIKEIGGLINVINSIYTLYTPEDFIEKWTFVSLTQGNRPQFVLKGTKITEEEENNE